MTTISPQMPPSSPRRHRPPREPKPKRDRWKRMPMRDANGDWAVIIEFRPVTSPLVQERFAELARTLYQKWVVEPPPYPCEPREIQPAAEINPIYGAIAATLPASPSTSTTSLPSESTHV